MLEKAFEKDDDLDHTLRYSACKSLLRISLLPILSAFTKRKGYCSIAVLNFKNCAASRLRLSAGLQSYHLVILNAVCSKQVKLTLNATNPKV